MWSLIVWATMALAAPVCASLSNSCNSRHHTDGEGPPVFLFLCKTNARVETSAAGYLLSCGLLHSHFLALAVNGGVINPQNFRRFRDARSAFQNFPHMNFLQLFQGNHVA